MASFFIFLLLKLIIQHRNSKLPPWFWTWHKFLYLVIIRLVECSILTIITTDLLEPVFNPIVSVTLLYCFGKLPQFRLCPNRRKNWFRYQFFGKLTGILSRGGGNSSKFGQGLIKVALTSHHAWLFLTSKWGLGLFSKDTVNLLALGIPSLASNSSLVLIPSSWCVWGRMCGSTIGVLEGFYLRHCFLAMTNSAFIELF